MSRSQLISIGLVAAILVAFVLWQSTRISALEDQARGTDASPASTPRSMEGTRGPLRLDDDEPESQPAPANTDRRTPGLHADDRQEAPVPSPAEAAARRIDTAGPKLVRQDSFARIWEQQRAAAIHACWGPEHGPPAGNYVPFEITLKGPGKPARVEISAQPRAGVSTRDPGARGERFRALAKCVLPFVEALDFVEVEGEQHLQAFVRGPN